MMSSRTRFWIAVALLAVLWLATMIAGGRDSSWDVAASDWLRSASVPILTRNARVFAAIGEPYVLVPIGIVAAAYLMFRRKRRAALFLIVVFGGRFLVELQKVIIDRPRPHISRALVAANSYSFPSGHAANAMITFMAIALLLPVRQRNRAIAVGIGLALALQVGASSVILDRHWASDALGGWLFGLMWVMICVWAASARPDADASAGR